MAEIIGLVGADCEDIALYIAKISVLLGKKTVIIDRTEQELLIQMMCGRMTKEQDIPEKSVTADGICVTAENVDYDEYDLVIFVFGFRLQHPKLYECGSLFLISDGLPAHAYLLQTIRQWERKEYLILRNMIPVKHSEKYIQKILRLEDEVCLYVSLSESDVKSRYQIGIEEKIQIKRLSGTMRHMLCRVIGILFPGEKESDIKRIMRKN